MTDSRCAEEPAPAREINSVKTSIKSSVLLASPTPTPRRRRRLSRSADRWMSSGFVRVERTERPTKSPRMGGLRVSEWVSEWSRCVHYTQSLISSDVVVVVVVVVKIGSNHISRPLPPLQRIPPTPHLCGSFQRTHHMLSGDARLVRHL